MPVPAVVQPCLDRAVLRAGSIVSHAAASALEALQADTQRRDAARELQLRMPGWRTRYADLLRKQLEEPAPAAPAAAPAGGTADRLSMLTLVDDTEIVQSIESTRVTQQIAAGVERPLADFDALMSSALGCDGIRPEQNPL